jgi:hypothetical protein
MAVSAIKIKHETNTTLFTHNVTMYIFIVFIFTVKKFAPVGFQMTIPPFVCPPTIATENGPCLLILSSAHEL